MRIRKMTSMTMLLSFVLLVFTSIVLYIVPEGRVAYWSDWRLWGLTKTQWGDLHVNLGFLFLLAGFFHIFFNWNVMIAYMKNRARQFRMFTADFNGALVLCLLVGIGTYLEIPPLSSILDLSASIKDSAATRYGEPPYGHAELSPLRSFFTKAELDPEKSMALLDKAGIRYEQQKTVLEIANMNNITPKALFDLMQPALLQQDKKPFPVAPFSGFGLKKLEEVCTTYQLPTDKVIRLLAEKNISAQPDQTIKEIAGAASMDPHAFFEVLREIVENL